jgi:hypothetical protein
MSLKTFEFDESCRAPEFDLRGRGSDRGPCMTTPFGPEAVKT